MVLRAAPEEIFQQAGSFLRLSLNVHGRVKLSQEARSMRPVHRSSTADPVVALLEAIDARASQN
jgi:hypothetical protein